MIFRLSCVLCLWSHLGENSAKYTLVVLNPLFFCSIQNTTIFSQFNLQVLYYLQFFFLQLLKLRLASSTRLVSYLQCNSLEKVKPFLDNRKSHVRIYLYKLTISLYINLWWWHCQESHKFLNRIGGVMVSMLAWSAIDHRIKSWSGIRGPGWLNEFSSWMT